MIDINMNPPPLPPDAEDTDAVWGRQPEETAKAYAGFLTYLQMEDRSVQKAYYVHRHLPIPGDRLVRQVPGQWAAWSSKHNWCARAREYDAWHQRRRLLAIQKQREDAYTRLGDVLDELTTELITIAKGAKKANNIQLTALLSALELAGVEKPSNKQNLGIVQNTQNNVHIYLPDNGRKVIENE